MPDWSYHPLFRPLLFRLPPELARDLTLGALGRLAALPFGLAVVEFLGHMRPPASLRQTLWGLDFPGPVGLGAGLDQRAVALPALARFGFGFLEVGPVTLAPVRAAGRVARRRDQQAIWYPATPVNGGLAALAGHLAVGYLDLWHLAPALVALLLSLLGLVLAYPYLCAPAPTAVPTAPLALPTPAERAGALARSTSGAAAPGDRPTGHRPQESRR